MTHDELLAKLNSASNADTCWKIAIIRAVVELHKPDSIGGCNACEQWTNEGPYPVSYTHLTLPTIYSV